MLNPLRFCEVRVGWKSLAGSLVDEGSSGKLLALVHIVSRIIVLIEDRL